MRKVYPYQGVVMIDLAYISNTWVSADKILQQFITPYNIVLHSVFAINVRNLEKRASEVFVAYKYALQGHKFCLMEMSATAFSITQVAIGLELEMDGRWTCRRILCHKRLMISSFPSAQNGRHFADDIFRCIFVKKKVLYFD